MIEASTSAAICPPIPFRFRNPKRLMISGRRR
jgi:hypothetical protein